MNTVLLYFQTSIKNEDTESAFFTQVALHLSSKNPLLPQCPPPNLQTKLPTSSTHVQTAAIFAPIERMATAPIPFPPSPAHNPTNPTICSRWRWPPLPTPARRWTRKNTPRTRHGRTRPKKVTAKNLGLKKEWKNEWGLRSLGRSSAPANMPPKKLTTPGTGNL